jgi:hypothetical protein
LRRRAFAVPKFVQQKFFSAKTEIPSRVESLAVCWVMKNRINLPANSSKGIALKQKAFHGKS